jgi:hypothetical protein
MIYSIELKKPLNLGLQGQGFIQLFNARDDAAKALKLAVMAMKQQ